MKIITYILFLSALPLIMSCNKNSLSKFTGSYETFLEGEGGIRIASTTVITKSNSELNIHFVSLEEELDFTMYAFDNGGDYLEIKRCESNVCLPENTIESGTITKVDGKINIHLQLLLDDNSFPPYRYGIDIIEL